MSISTNVNVQFLTEYFHLAPFNDLKAVDLGDVYYMASITVFFMNIQVFFFQSIDWPSVFCIELFCIDEKYEARFEKFILDFSL